MSRPVCVVRPCDWEYDGHVELANWGKQVAAAKDAAVGEYGRWDGHFYAVIPKPPAGYFEDDSDNYYIREAITAAWKYWGKYA
jgi:hypothetical protein